VTRGDDLATAQINAVRAAIGQIYLRGEGLEVGGGASPFPLPPGARAAYGDVRGIEDLQRYFDEPGVVRSLEVDAQTFAGIKRETQDFLIAAHVIEHLFDPIGSIVQAIRVLKPGGVFILAVPDKRLTFDVDRPETDLAHVLADRLDGGAGTRLQAYREHYTYVHPRFQAALTPTELEELLAGLGEPWPDIHVHCWTRDGFERLLKAAQRFAPFRIEAAVSNLHENIFVLRRRQTLPRPIHRGLRRLRALIGRRLGRGPSARGV
jgi:SAM-dependent methyltransferase